MEIGLGDNSFAHTVSTVLILITLSTSLFCHGLTLSICNFDLQTQPGSFEKVQSFHLPTLRRIPCSPPPVEMLLDTCTKLRPHYTILAPFLLLTSRSSFLILQKAPLSLPPQTSGPQVSTSEKYGSASSNTSPAPSISRSGFSSQPPNNWCP